jgi:hypothetical protein
MSRSIITPSTSLSTSLSTQPAVKTVDHKMLGPQLLTAKVVLSLEREYTDGEIFSIYNDNFELGDVDESILEDWKLPPSIEDEEATPLDMTLEEPRGTLGEATLFILI